MGMGHLAETTARGQGVGVGCGGGGGVLLGLYSCDAQ